MFVTPAARVNLFPTTAVSPWVSFGGGFGHISQSKALETYEDVSRQRVDPSLLEYAGGNTFSGRVYPIPAKAFTRIVFTYEETLPIVAGANATSKDALNRLSRAMQKTAVSLLNTSLYDIINPAVCEGVFAPSLTY